MAMNPRDAATAKGCIDSMISFTKAKLLPHAADIRSIHSQHLVGRRSGQKMQYINAVPALDRRRVREHVGSGDRGEARRCQMVGSRSLRWS
jgi:hypothetical protein